MRISTRYLVLLISFVFLGTWARDGLGLAIVLMVALIFIAIFTLPIVTIGARR